MKVLLVLVTFGSILLVFSIFVAWMEGKLCYPSLLEELYDEKIEPWLRKKLRLEESEDNLRKIHVLSHTTNDLAKQVETLKAHVDNVSIKWAAAKQDSMMYLREIERLKELLREKKDNG